VSNEITTISFNSEYIDIVEKLTAISPGIIFSKDPAEKKIVINRTNKNRTIFFKLTAPEDYFTFAGDKIAFYNFSEFVSLVSAFGTPKLFHKANKIVIDSEIGKINYVLSSPEALPRSPSKITLPEPDIAFIMSAEALGDLKKINTLMHTSFANISIVEKAITLKLFNSTHENSFDRQYTPDFIAVGLENFDFPIYSEIFTRLPAKMNYRISIYKKGFVHIAFSDKGIDFIAIIGRVKKIGNSDADSTAETTDGATTE